MSGATWWLVDRMQVYPVFCLTCKYRSHDGCMLWEELVQDDYSCDAWRIDPDLKDDFKIRRV